jgi:hypothetical protein
MRKRKLTELELKHVFGGGDPTQDPTQTPAPKPKPKDPTQDPKPCDLLSITIIIPL